MIDRNKLSKAEQRRYDAMHDKFIDGWYYFSCQPKPVRIKVGFLPNPPYIKFETEKECWNYIKKKADE